MKVRFLVDDTMPEWFTATRGSGSEEWEENCLTIVCKQPEVISTLLPIVFRGHYRMRSNWGRLVHRLHPNVYEFVRTPGGDQGLRGERAG